jgi:hypothetical protein
MDMWNRTGPSLARATVIESFGGYGNYLRALNGAREAVFAEGELLQRKWDEHDEVTTRVLVACT